VQNNRYNNI